MKKENKSLLNNLKEMQKNSKIHRNITVTLSCIVALITLYALMSPAITLNENGEYKLYLKDSYLNDNYAWKNEQGYVTSIGTKLYFADTDKNPIDGKNITIDIGNNYSDDTFAFGKIPLKEDGTEGKNILKENEIETILVDNGKYVFDHAEVYVNNNWQELGLDSKIWCQNCTSETEPVDKDYGFKGINGVTVYSINENVEYKLVYSFEETKKEVSNEEDLQTENQEEQEELLKQEEKQTDEVEESNEIVEENKTQEQVVIKSPSIKSTKSLKSTSRALSTANSVDSLGSGSGIKFGIYNYSGDNTETEINANGLYKYFTFRDSQLTGSVINAELDADGFGPNRVKVKSKLDASGNPVFDCQGKCDNDTSVKNTSLGYLFGETTNAKGTTTVGVQPYNPNNTPLQKEQIEGVDYFYYDSNRNAVDYDTVNDKFIVRNYRERGYLTTTFTNENTRYEFLPFNYKENASSPNGSYNYESATDTTEIDHWYGMTMEFEFYMPKDGKINNKDMIFSFSGDDDVWVFIDDVLVLDLGGTHGSVDGSINFHTGVVNSYLNWDGTVGTVDAGTANNTSIKQMFQNAKETKEWNASGTTFANYTKHKLKFFYLERGAAVANCKIRFNIPVLPSGSLAVKKQFEGVEKYADNYEFVLYDVTNGSPVPSGTKYTIGEDEYTIDNNEGKFTLKNGEVAIFVSKNEQNDPNGEYLRNNKYYVRESNSGQNAVIYACNLDGTNCPTVDKTQEFIMNPESKYQATFTNKTKTYNLKLTKDAINNSEDEMFDFKVSMQDEFGNKIDISKLSLSFPNGYTINQNDKGIVTFKLKDLESITINNIPINTKILIQEVDHDGYHTSMKSIVNGKEVSLVESDTYTIEKISDNKEIKVYNTPGVILPETGGIGIILYTIIGLTLIVGSIFGYTYLYRLKEGDL